MPDECQRQVVPDVGYKSHAFTRIATCIYCFIHEHYSIMLIIAVVPVFVVVLIKAINARLKDTDTDVKV